MASPFYLIVYNGVKKRRYISAMLIIRARSNFKLWIVNKRFAMQGAGGRARTHRSWCGALSVLLSLNGDSHAICIFSI